MDKKTLTLAVKDIEGMTEFGWLKVRRPRFFVCKIAVDLSAVARGQNTKARKIPLGVTLANSMVVFERAEGSSINLAGKSKG